MDPQYDALLATVAKEIGEHDFRVLVERLEGQEAEQVDWEVAVTEEVEALWSQACKEVVRVHGRSLKSTTILQYVLAAVIRGVWPEVDHRPPVHAVLSTIKSLGRRLSVPSFATATLHCDCCDRLWRYGSRGEVLIPDPLRVIQIRYGAEVTRWLPAAQDRDLETTALGASNRRHVEKAVRKATRCEAQGCDVHLFTLPQWHADGLLWAYPRGAVAGDKETSDAKAGERGDLVCLCPGHFRAATRRHFERRESRGFESRQLVDSARGCTSQRGRFWPSWSGLGRRFRAGTERAPPIMAGFWS